jgi:hypothetical protein
MDGIDENYGREILCLCVAQIVQTVAHFCQATLGGWYPAAL